MPLQNGSIAKSEIHVSKKRLHVQTRLKRFIFLSSLGKSQGNLFASVGQETCTSSFAIALIWHQHYEYLQNRYKCQ